MTDSRKHPSGAARAAAAAAVHAVTCLGYSLERALTAQQRRFSVSERDHGLVQELAYGTLRRCWTLERRISPLLRNQPADLPRALLLVGAYQVTELGMPAHAAVSETVSACDCLGQRHVKGFINAVLRALLRASSPKALVSADFDHPPWLLARIKAAWPEQWQQVLMANNQRAPMSLRVNRRQVTRNQYLEQLNERLIKAFNCEIAEDGIILTTPMSVDALPGFRQGMVSVQDCSAQIAAQLLGAHAGDRVADLCAAPGGKAAHILEREPDVSELLAVEKEGDRLERLQSTFERLGLKATVRHADAADLTTWWDGQPFARVLLDAPCSGSGVIRRHPDIKHLRRDSDFEILTRSQTNLLRAGFAVLAAGGRLLYVTCSILPVENDAVIGAFLSRETGARSVSISAAAGCATAYGWQLLPGTHGDVDGFYYSLLERRK